MKKKIRFDEIDFIEAKFYAEDGFDIHLSVKFNKQFEELFDIAESFRYPSINVACTADGEILDMTIENGTSKYDVIDLTSEEKSDILFFITKHDLVFELAEQNEFPIGREWKDDLRVGAY